MQKIKVITLFSGIGSQEMALRNLGLDYEVVGISEIDKFALKAMKQYMEKSTTLEIFQKLRNCLIVTYLHTLFLVRI